MFGSDWLANLFLSFFLFGLIFTILSLVFGWVGGADAGHAGADAGGADVGHDLGHDVGHDLGHGVGHEIGHEAAHSGPSVFNLPTIMASITWFGGVGYLLRATLSMNAVFASVLAIISGLIGGAIMFVLLARVLWPMMTPPMQRADFRLPGTPARVVSPIREGGVGEIVYTKAGNRFTSGARSVDERAIAKGAEVVIVKYERGLAYVQDVEALLNGEHEPEEAARKETPVS
ncbi:MAG TPA: hypothetical protein VFR15_12670 [Chloroflexia bacterium]|nr:hypothetical protein [Chloroflexia bacterium]